MMAVKTFLAGGAALAALTVAAPAQAQYYPGYGYGGGGGGGEIIAQVLGGMINGNVGYGYGSQAYGTPYGYGSPYGQSYGYSQSYGYGPNYGYGGNYGGSYGGYNRGGQVNQQAVGQCMGAVQQRLNASYGGGQSARVLGVSDVQRRNNGGTLVSGVANSGRNANAYAYGGQPQVDLTFTCKTDSAGYVSSIEIGQAQYVSGQAAPAYTPYTQDYSQYGYRRY